MLIDTETLQTSSGAAELSHRLTTTKSFSSDKFWLTWNISWNLSPKRTVWLCQNDKEHHESLQASKSFASVQHSPLFSFCSVLPNGVWCPGTGCLYSSPHQAPEAREKIVLYIPNRIL